MNSRWLTLVSASLVAFAGLVIAWQVRHYDESDNLYSSIALSFIRGKQMAVISNIVERDELSISASKAYRSLDLSLLKEARVFMTDMTGPTNCNKIGHYFFAAYYLFPREIGVSVDQPTRLTYNGFLGRTSDSDQEILAKGYDVRFDNFPGGELDVKPLRSLPMKFPTNPAWFNSIYDMVIAFLLPWLTALAGMWLFRLLFPALSVQMQLLEQLACGLGLGMMAVAAFTLGIKLCGGHGYHLVLLTTAAGAIAEIWRNRNVYWASTADGFWKMVHNPVITAIFLAEALVFLVLFRLAGLQGLLEFDAMRWMLKAKIMHLYTGSEIVKWFSNPALSYAHLDYPTLVPSLHAATYDSIGHVDEFVTKFWPTWMLLFLIAALASLNRAGRSRLYAPHFALLGFLLLPVTQMYVHWEGGTLPMVFFTVLGFVQCALWLIGKDRARLGLGLTLLFGAAMAKFEGFMFLTLVGGWMLLLPSARPSLKPSLGFWRVLAFCFLAALPFICLRVQIPALHPESDWAGYALHNFGNTLSHWPGIFMILLARMFMSPDFASWSGEGGQLHWIGKWDGFSSLYNHPTIGLAWLCLFMAMALWFAFPARRPVIVWTLAMVVGALAALGGVFASILNITNLAQVLDYTADELAGRYLLPVLLAWFATLITMFFAELPSSTSTPASSTDVKGVGAARE